MALVPDQAKSSSQGRRPPLEVNLAALGFGLTHLEPRKENMVENVFAGLFSTDSREDPAPLLETVLPGPFVGPPLLLGEDQLRITLPQLRRGLNF